MRFTVLALLLAACATPGYTDRKAVEIDGRTIYVSRSANYPGQWIAVEIPHAPGVYPARNHRHVRAIEAVSGCEVDPSSVLNDLRHTQAFVVC